MRRVTKQDAMDALDLLKIYKDTIIGDFIPMGFCALVSEFSRTKRLNEEQELKLTIKIRKLAMHLNGRNKYRLWWFAPSDWESRVDFLNSLIEKYNNYKSTKTKLTIHK